MKRNTITKSVKSLGFTRVSAFIVALIAALAGAAKAQVPDHGIVYNDHAAGTASENECLSNNGDSSYGDNIKVYPYAQPILTDNETHGESEEEDAFYTEEFSQRLMMQMLSHALTEKGFASTYRNEAVHYGLRIVSRSCLRGF